MSSDPKLSEAEIVAMRALSRGGVPTAGLLDEKTTTDHLGRVIPGVRVFRSLEKKGLVLFTEPLPIDPEKPDGDCWDPSVDLTETGAAYCRKNFEARSPRP